MSAAASNAPEPERLYRIGDVSRLTDTKPFVLRFWETEFPMLQPVKAPKGHRLYRQQDIELIRAIKRLLYEEGFTIAGARRHLAEALAGGAPVTAPAGKAPVFASNAQFDPARAAATLPFDSQPERTGARPDSTALGKIPRDARGTLVTVRQELRAILTLLGTR
jgi:DNA-binding transcriptional MerR regulator